jgi:hypothetical protein
MADGTFDDEIAVKDEPVEDLWSILSEMVVIWRLQPCKMGTFGKLIYKDFWCYTVELPWENNAPFISCVPVGIYPIKLGMFYQTERPYKTWELKQIAGRSDIDIHVANHIGDLKGCIGLGNDLGCVDNKWAVLNSKKTHKRFMEAMRDSGAEEAEHMYVCIKNADINPWSEPAYVNIGG